MSSPEPNRCRLVLIVPETAGADALIAALSGGDVASVIISAGGADEAQVQSRAEQLVKAAQAADAAALIVNDTRMAGRTGADGLHVEGDLTHFPAMVEKNAGKAIIGAGDIKTRHHALEIGEARPDYIMFGKTGGDTRPEANPKNVELGEWWASMVELPCIVLGGSGVESVTAVADTGAEFVALSAAVFAGADPAGAVRHANALLDASAPRFET
jgi:thiamine-phosphate pyrophosphorylase